MNIKMLMIIRICLFRLLFASDVKQIPILHIPRVWKSIKVLEVS